MPPASKGKNGAEKDKIPIGSAQELAAELKDFKAALSVKETEHTWEALDRAVKRFTAVTRGGGYRFEVEYVAGLRDRDLARAIVGCLSTERTQLSASTLLFLSAATRLGHSFAPLLFLYLAPIIRLLSRTNKLYISRATACLVAIVRNTRLAGVIPYLREGLLEKSASHRKGCLAGLSCALGGPDTLSPISSWKYEGMILDKEVVQRKYLDDIETCIRLGARDKDLEVRRIAKTCWEIYRTEFADRIANFVKPLSPTARRYLELPPAGHSVSDYAVSASMPSLVTGTTSNGSSRPLQPKAVLASTLGASASRAPASPPRAGLPANAPHAINVITHTVVRPPSRLLSSQAVSNQEALQASVAPGRPYHIDPLPLSSSQSRPPPTHFARRVLPPSADAPGPILLKSVDSERLVRSLTSATDRQVPAILPRTNPPALSRSHTAERPPQLPSILPSWLSQHHRAATEPGLVSDSNLTAHHAPTQPLSASTSRDLPAVMNFTDEVAQLSLAKEREPLPLASSSQIEHNVQQASLQPSEIALSQALPTGRTTHPQQRRAVPLQTQNQSQRAPARAARRASRVLPPSEDMQQWTDVTSATGAIDAAKVPVDNAQPAIQLPAKRPASAMSLASNASAQSEGAQSGITLQAKPLPPSAQASPALVNPISMSPTPSAAISSTSASVISDSEPQTSTTDRSQITQDYEPLGDMLVGSREVSGGDVEEEKNLHKTAASESASQLQRPDRVPPNFEGESVSTKCATALPNPSSTAQELSQQTIASMQQECPAQTVVEEAPVLENPLPRFLQQDQTKAQTLENNTHPSARGGALPLFHRPILADKRQKTAFRPQRHRVPTTEEKPLVIQPGPVQKVSRGPAGEVAKLEEPSLVGPIFPVVGKPTASCESSSTAVSPPGESHERISALNPLQQSSTTANKEPPTARPLGAPVAASASTFAHRTGPPPDKRQAVSNTKPSSSVRSVKLPPTTRAPVAAKTQPVPTASSSLKASSGRSTARPGSIFSRLAAPTAASAARAKPRIVSEPKETFKKPAPVSKPLSKQSSSASLKSSLEPSATRQDLSKSTGFQRKAVGADNAAVARPIDQQQIDDTQLKENAAADGRYRPVRLDVETFHTYLDTQPGLTAAPHQGDTKSSGLESKGSPWAPDNGQSNTADSDTFVSIDLVDPSKAGYALPEATSVFFPACPVENHPVEDLPSLSSSQSSLNKVASNDRSAEIFSNVHEGSLFPSTQHRLAGVSSPDNGKAVHSTAADSPLATSSDSCEDPQAREILHQIPLANAVHVPGALPEANQERRDLAPEAIPLPDEDEDSILEDPLPLDQTIIMHDLESSDEDEAHNPAAISILKDVAADVDPPMSVAPNAAVTTATTSNCTASHEAVGPITGTPKLTRTSESHLIAPSSASTSGDTSSSILCSPFRGMQNLLTRSQYGSKADETLLVDQQYAPDQGQYNYDETFVEFKGHGGTGYVAGIGKDRLQSQTGDFATALQALHIDEPEDRYTEGDQLVNGDEDEDDIALLISRELSSDSLEELASRWEESRIDTGLLGPEDDEQATDIDQTPMRPRLLTRLSDGYDEDGYSKSDEEEALGILLNMGKGSQQAPAHEEDNPTSGMFTLGPSTVKRRVEAGNILAGMADLGRTPTATKTTATYDVAQVGVGPRQPEETHSNSILREGGIY